MTEDSNPLIDDVTRVTRAELLLDYICKKVREQVPKEAEKSAEKEA